MKKSFLIFLSTLFLNLNLVLAASAPEKPDHLLFMVFDQMRPDYIDRFDLKNFKRLRAMGTNYKNAYVGQLPSITVVSHVVMTTGLLPKDLPISDATAWDKDGRWGSKDKIVDTQKVPHDVFLKVMSLLPPDIFFNKRFKDATNKKVFSVGQKNYSPVGMGGPFADTIIYMKKDKGTWSPTGLNVPEYIQSNNRYVVDGKDKHGTEDSFYSIDGNKYYPGKDPNHLGGDIWVADIALDIMKNEKNWGALYLTFGAIDKFGHMLGQTDGNNPLSFTPPASLKEIAKIADEQLGRLLKKLEDDKILDSTLIISTADHGAQTDTVYLGDASHLDPNPFWIDRIAQLAKVKATEQDTAIRIWLENTEEENFKKAIRAAKEISKVTKIYTLDKKQKPLRYKEVFNNIKSESPAFQKWAKAHDQELVDTMANENAPDIMVLLADGVGFGKIGDHGGAQEKVQRIPIMVAGPGFKKTTSLEPKRLVDLEPLMTKAFGLPEKKPLSQEH